MRKLIGATTGLLSYLALTTPAFGAFISTCPQNDAAQQNKFNVLCSLNYENFGPLVGRLITLLLVVAIVISLFFLIYGGIKWITSGGDKGAVDAARNHIIAAIVGLVISLLAFFIIQLIGGLFGISVVNLQLPTLTQ